MTEDQDDRKLPYWVLISILFTNLPLSPPLAERLHRLAYDLYRRDDGVVRLEEGELGQGEVRNLRKTVCLGTLTGPAFEALLDTPYGTGTVHFLLTQQGIELMTERETIPARLN